MHGCNQGSVCRASSGWQFTTTAKCRGPGWPRAAECECRHADFAEQEGQRSGNERNYQRVLDRLAPYQDKKDQHTKNIEALQNELGSLR